jgi:predicted nucleotidyltransferase
MLTDTDIRRIVERVVAGCGPLAVGIFGSYAVDRARGASDLDLFVIQQTRLPPSARRRAVMQTLFGILHPLDVHVFTPEEFEAGTLEELSFTWIIVRQARVYHWSPGAAALVPSLAKPARRLGPCPCP